jgi:NADPH:quinone reductase-like Zn-dependent oxidoreductase
MQIASAIGAKPIGTSRSEDKIETVQKLGLAAAFPVSENARFADKVLEITGGKGVNLVLELVGGRYFTEDLRCTSYRGRIILVGLLGGSAGEVDLGMILRNRLTIRGTTLRSRPMEEKIAVTERFAQHMLPLLADGTIKPIIDRLFPIDQAAEAHRYVAGNANFGKVVLEVSQ